MDVLVNSINEAKSQIFFFNTPIRIQMSITQILDFRRSPLPYKYMGLPLTQNTLSQDTWHNLFARLENCFSSWTFRSLNLVARVILLKSISQANPIYLFSSLSTRKMILKIIKGIQSIFLWQCINKESKWALIAWDTLCLPK